MLLHNDGTMKLLLVSIAALILKISTTSGHSLAKIELKNPSDVVYKVEEDRDSNTITIVNPKPEKPTLREIIYYHVVEKALGSNEEVSEGPDFDDTRRPFTNSHGYPYLFLDPHDDSEEVTTETTLEESTHASKIPSNKRLKREAIFPDIPKGPELEKLNYENLPKYVKDHSARLCHEDSDDYSYEYHSSEEHDPGRHSDEHWVPGPSIRDTEDSTDNYGMNLTKDSGYVWNNLIRPHYKYNVHEDPHSGEDSESEENSDSASEDDSDQSDFSNEDSHSHEGNGASESASHESDSQSQEDYTQSVEDSNEEPNGRVSQASIEDNYQEWNEVLNSIDEEIGKDSNEVSSEFDHILSVFTDDDSKLHETGDKQKVNILHILMDIFDNIVKNETNNPQITLVIKEGDKIPNILMTLHGLITNIIRNDITITNNLVGAKPNLVDDKDKIDNNISQDTTESKVSDDTESLFTPVISITTEIPNTTFNINTELTTKLKESTDLITEGYTTLNLDGNTETPETEIAHEVITESPEESEDIDQLNSNHKPIDILNPSNDESNVPIETENPEHDHSNKSSSVNPTDKTDQGIKPPTEIENPKPAQNYLNIDKVTTEQPNQTVTNNDKQDNGLDISKETEIPITINVNIESIPGNDSNQFSGNQNVNKLDIMTELMNNEKFWTFMGDLAGKYLEELMARTGLFIKREVENQLKELLQAQKKEEIPKENKEEVIHNDGDTSINDKITNVNVFYLNKYSKLVMEDIKKLVNGNNGTNIFTIGIDNTKDDSKGSDNDVSTHAPVTYLDIPFKTSTVLIEETTSSNLNSEAITGLDKTTTNDIPIVTAALNIDVTDTNGVHLNEEKYTTSNELETNATESPQTTVSDINSNDITDSATINNEITEVTPATENNEMTSTAENEITVTVTFSDSSDVTTQSETVTTPADDTQVSINIIVNVPVTEPTTEKSENELTTDNSTAYTDIETVVTDVSENVQTSTLNSEIITETTDKIDITSGNEFLTIETSKNEDITEKPIIISSTESEILTTVHSESGEVTTDSENISITDENAFITTDTPIDIDTTSESNNEVVVTTVSPDNSNSGDVTGNYDVTKVTSVPDKVPTSFDPVEANTEVTPSSDKNIDLDIGNHDNNLSTTSDNIFDGEITTETSVNEAVTNASEEPSTELTAEVHEKEPIKSHIGLNENANSKYNISDNNKEIDTHETSETNEVDNDNINSEDSTLKLDEDITEATTEVANSNEDDIPEHDEGLHSNSDLEGNSEDTPESNSSTLGHEDDKPGTDSTKDNIEITTETVEETNLNKNKEEKKTQINKNNENISNNGSNELQTEKSDRKKSHDNSETLDSDANVSDVTENYLETSREPQLWSEDSKENEISH